MNKSFSVPVPLGRLQGFSLLQFVRRVSWENMGNKCFTRQESSFLIQLNDVYKSKLLGRYLL